MNAEYIPWSVIKSPFRQGASHGENENKLTEDIQMEQAQISRKTGQANEGNRRAPKPSAIRVPERAQKARTEEKEGHPPPPPTLRVFNVPHEAHRSPAKEAINSKKISRFFFPTHQSELPLLLSSSSPARPQLLSPFSLSPSSLSLVLPQAESPRQDGKVQYSPRALVKTIYTPLLNE